MEITYAKLQKNSRSRFFKPQPARASLNWVRAEIMMVLIWEKNTYRYMTKLPFIRKYKYELEKWNFEERTKIGTGSGTFS